MLDFPGAKETTFIFVHAHPDDETLWTGGLIATAARAGCRVIVVTCTRGERGEVLALPGTASENEGWREGKGTALADYRTGELSRALNKLAAGAEVLIEHYFLDELPLPEELRLSQAPQDNNRRYEDSGMVWVASGIAGPTPDSPNSFSSAPFTPAPLTETTARLSALLSQARQHNPDHQLIVVTYEQGGGYLHPDHVRAHQIAVAAIEQNQTIAQAKYAVELDQAWEQGAKACAATPLQSVPPKPIELLETVVPWDDAAQSLAALRSAPQIAALLEPQTGNSSAAVASTLNSNATGNLADLVGSCSATRKNRLILPEPLTAAAKPPMVLPPDEQPDVVIPLAPVLANLIAAMREYATQIQAAQAIPGLADQGVLGVFALSNGVLCPIRATETYRYHRLTPTPGGLIGDARLGQ